ncbi:MAG: beta strand repeat-containing protein, partial [Victivallaceae bacterium]
MANVTKLNVIDSRRTSPLDVDVNLVITTRGSIAVTAGNPAYALNFLESANNYAATISGGVSLTGTRSDAATLLIAAENYTIKTGSAKPVFLLTLTGLADDSRTFGSVIKGNRLILGNAGDPAAFGATITSGVTSVANAAAISHAISLAGALSIVSREFNSSITATARSANAEATAYDICADTVDFVTFGAAGLLSATATAGSKAGSQNAFAAGILGQTSVSGGNFAARVNVSATAGSGAGGDTSEASATASGIRSYGSLSLGVLKSGFTVTAKSGNVPGSFASARGISYFEIAGIGGFSTGTVFNITATGPYGAEAAGIFGDGDLQILNGLVGTWTVTATGGELSEFEYAGRAAMIYAEEGGTFISGDFNSTIKVSASSTKGVNAAAGGIVSGSDLNITNQINGSLTVEAKVTGKSSELRFAENTQSSACGLMSKNAIYLGNGFASAFRMNITSAGIDSADATAIAADAIYGGSGPAGTWTVSATSTGGQVDGGFAGDADAAGIRTETGDISFSMQPGAKLTLTVSALGNTANLISIQNAQSDAVGISAAGNIVLSELGILTVSAKSGKTGGTGIATAKGLSGSAIALRSLTGMNITASADTWAQAMGMAVDMGFGLADFLPISGIAINSISGTYNVTAAALRGSADAIGFGASQIALGSIAAGSALNVKATGGILTLVEGLPVDGSDSSATAAGIEGGISGCLPTLTVTATSGKNAASNQAIAYGIHNESALDSTVAGVRRMTVTATAVDIAQSIGYQNTVLNGFGSHVESVSAISSESVALATGYQSIVDTLAMDLSGSLSVTARGKYFSSAFGIEGCGTFYLGTNADQQHQMTVIANSTNYQASAVGLQATFVDLKFGLWANWTVTATSVNDSVCAYIMNVTGEVALDDLNNKISGLNGVYTASANGKTGASAFGFQVRGGNLDSDFRGKNLSLTVAAKSAGGFAGASGLEFNSIDFDSASYRDTLTLTADGYGAAEASGIEGTGQGPVEVYTNSLFALSATAKSATSYASALGISNTDGALEVVLDGTTNISATGGKTATGEYVYAMALGVMGRSREASADDSSPEIGADSVAILQTLNVTAKSGSGGATSFEMYAAAYGALCSSGSTSDERSLFQGSARTKATIKADGVGNAFAVGVLGEAMDASVNGAVFAVTALSSESVAQDIGIGARTQLLISDAALNLNVSATGGKAKVADSTNAIAFGLFAGNWNSNGTLDSAVDSSLRIGSDRRTFVEGPEAKLDGTLTVSAKAVAGTVDGSRVAHAAGLAAVNVFGASAESLKVNVRAETGDQLARALGIQGGDQSEAPSAIQFDMQGNWKVAAVAATGNAIAYGIGETDLIAVGSSSDKTQLQVSAEADMVACAYGFFAESDFSGLDNLALAMTVTATSRKGAFADAVGIHAVDSTLALDGTIAVTASGTGSSAAGIYSSGSMMVNGVVAAAVAKTGSAYAISSNAESGYGLDIQIGGAIFGDR